VFLFHPTKDKLIALFPPSAFTLIGRDPFISLNWRAKPLISLEVVLDLLNHTTTEEGLTVTAIKDSHTYPTGIEVTNDEMKDLHLIRHSFHPDWNYTIKPQPT